MLAVVAVALAVAAAPGLSDVDDVPPPLSAPPLTPPPPPAAPPVASLTGAPTVKVRVLPVRGSHLSDDEARLLERLVGIRVERLGLEVVRNDENAGAVDIEIETDHAKLGEADVVTFEADVVSGPRRASFRDATSALQRGELAEKMNPVVDALLQRALSALPPVTRPDVQKRIAEGSLAVCDDGGGTWFFCDGTHHAVTENDFVRRYRNETGRHDLDTAELDRAPDYTPWMFLLAGGAAGLATIGGTVALGSTTEGQAFARQSDDAWIVLPVLGLSAALGLVVYGAIELDDGPSIHDGTELDHVLDEASARRSVRAFNDAVKLRVERDAGG